MSRLVKKIKVITTLELVTGLHIGGSKDNVEIGGIDTPVIKIATKNYQPYIPGSSIKGKMRCLLEQIAGTAEVGGGKLEEGKTREEKQQKINNLFGYSEDNLPSKIIVRDAYLQKDSVTTLLSCDNLDMPYTEAKMENVINRFKGMADPRTIERIPAGVFFDVEFVINVWDTDGDGKSLIALIENGIKALENDYLGGNGSRGYGQIKFGKLNYEPIPFDKYFENEK